MALRIDGRDANVTPPRGTSIGLALPAHFGPVTAAFGLAVYMPDQFIARIQLVPATEPHFVLLDNNLQHVVAQPVVAFRFGDKVAIGAGALDPRRRRRRRCHLRRRRHRGQQGRPGRARRVTADPRRTGRRHRRHAAPVAAPRRRLSRRARPQALARHPGARRISPAPSAATRSSRWRALNFYSPHTLTGAVAVDLGALTLTAELDWLKWSGFDRALPDLHRARRPGHRAAVGVALVPGGALRRPVHRALRRRVAPHTQRAHRSGGAARLRVHPVADAAADRADQLRRQRSPRHRLRRRRCR